MQKSSALRWLAMLTLVIASAAGTAFAQGTAGSISGTVEDATGAVIPGATVVIVNAVSGYTRTVKSDGSGQFHFLNVPFNPYKVTVTEAGFETFSKTVELDSAIAVTVPVKLAAATANTVVTVDAPVDLVEADSTAHTDIDRYGLQPDFPEVPSADAAAAALGACVPPRQQF